MAIDPALFASGNGEWETPDELYDQLNREFRFTCDVAATPDNAKCSEYITKDDNALARPWSGTCWCNPPYGRGVDAWVEKAHQEAQQGVTTVMLLPARTDVRWFHDHVYGRYEIRFLRGRLRFVGAPSSAPFPSMIVIFSKVRR